MPATKKSVFDLSVGPAHIRALSEEYRTLLRLDFISPSHRLDALLRERQVRYSAHSQTQSSQPAAVQAALGLIFQPIIKESEPDEADGDFLFRGRCSPRSLICSLNRYVRQFEERGLRKPLKGLEKGSILGRHLGLETPVNLI